MTVDWRDDLDGPPVPACGMWWLARVAVTVMLAFGLVVVLISH